MSRDSDALPNNFGDEGDAPPRQRRRRRGFRMSEGTLSILDRLLRQPRMMILEGVRTEVPTIQLIILRLVQKDIAGNRGAQNVLFAYKEFASRSSKHQLKILFVDNNYSQKDSEHGSESENG